MSMRVFLIACLAAVVIAGSAYFVLNAFVPDSVEQAFSTQATRI